MTSTIETGKRVAMLATVGGIGATVALLIAASHTSADHSGFVLSLDYTGATNLWKIVTAGVFWATIFNWLFETWIWRFSFLQGWLVKVPDLSGVWIGTSESRFFKDKDGNYQAINLEAKIDHRFEKIIYTQAGLSKSTALAVDLRTDENGFWTLTVVYENLPQTKKSGEGASEELAENVSEHRGCAIMMLSRPHKERSISAQWTLNGAYWTDKLRPKHSGDRGTTGVLDLRWSRRL